jgi:BexC/CtrB/KpsE family polysaccharide export inner-membrane protein
MNALEPVTSRAAVLRDNARQVLESDSRAGSAARALREEILNRPFRLYIAVITALAVFYYGIVATPLFVSQTQFALKSKSAVPTVPLISTLTGAPSVGITELTAIKQYIQSRELLTKLDAKLHLRDQYTRPRADFMNYLSPNATVKEFLRFYNSMISVDVDTDTSIITLEVHSYDASSAHALASMILNESSAFIDNLSDQMRQESIRSADVDYRGALADDIKAKNAVAEFRGKVGDLDPVNAGSSAASSVASMQANIAALNTQMAALKTYSTDNSPAVQQLAAQIKYLQQRIAEVQHHMVGATETNSLNKQLDRYHDLVIQQTYADQRLVAAQAAVDAAKSVAAQKELFIVAITHPDFPDRATLPSRLWNIASIIVLAATFYGIMTLGLAGVRDHQVEEDL